MQRVPKLPPLLNVLYTHNPFYLLSTCFVLFAIHRAFRPGVVEYVNPWALMASLSAFTLLAAATACVVVRCGKVWEDARSILLVLVLMFLAISVSFDELLNLFAAEGITFLAFGFGFSILVAEGVLRGVRIRFPAAYRVPFYLMLALFFGYPIAVSPEVTGLSLVDTRWRIAMFPSCAGAIALLLLFAVRRGRALAETNRTPWRWPWYPWTVFGFLAVGVCARSYSLSISFDQSSGHVADMYSVFDWYLLIPFAFSVLILLLEIGIVERLPRLRNGVIYCALVLLPMALSTSTGDPTQSAFRATFVETAASPLFLTLLALIVFYLYAWWRGVQLAEAAATGMLLLATAVGPATVEFGRPQDPYLWPVALLACLQLSTAFRRRSGARAFAAAVSVTVILTALIPPVESAAYRVLVPAHLLLLAMIGIGLLDWGRFARLLAAGTAAVLPPLAFVTVYILLKSQSAETTVLAYFAGVSGLASAYWYFTGDRRFLAAGVVNATAGCCGGIWFGSQMLIRRLGPDVMQPLLYGTACFLVGALISAHKARVFRKTGTAPPGAFSAESPPSAG